MEGILIDFLPSLSQEMSLTQQVSGIVTGPPARASPGNLLGMPSQMCSVRHSGGGAQHSVLTSHPGDSDVASVRTTALS